MKISTKGIYGLEAIVDLAINSAENHVSLKSISERCEISEAYILQIFLILRRAGVVGSVRGAQGGYYLAKEPKDITVGEVLTALEGPLAPVECLINENNKSCDSYEKCATQIVWKNIMDALNEVVYSVSIKDLTDCYNSLKSNNIEDIEYYI